MELYERSDYRSEIPFLFNNYIREYDISKANINILYWKNVLSHDMYIELYNSPRDVRQYVIGNMQKDSKVNEILMNGFIECRKMFLTENGLTELDILSIKKDAIFIINKIPKVTKFGNIEFMQKNVYTSYMSFFNKKLELYYSSSKVTGNGIEKIDVKGISEQKLIMHKDFMLDFLYYIFDMIENDSLENAIEGFRRFYNQYINKELNIGYYRNLNPESAFTINYKSPFNQFIKYEIEQSYLAYKEFDSINISYNMNLLRIIFQYLSSIHFKRQ